MKLFSQSKAESSADGSHQSWRCPPCSGRVFERQNRVLVEVPNLRTSGALPEGRWLDAMTRSTPRLPAPWHTQKLLQDAAPWKAPQRLWSETRP
eukprot:855826-Amphidinium_carterae.1